MSKNDGLSFKIDKKFKLREVKLRLSILNNKPSFFDIFLVLGSGTVFQKKNKTDEISRHFYANFGTSIWNAYSRYPQRSYGL